MLERDTIDLSGQRSGYISLTLRRRVAFRREAETFAFLRIYVLSNYFEEFDPSFWIEISIASS
jgi:hypothetical protein